MNVKPGDLARIVNSGTVNDGAIVRVKTRNPWAESFFEHGAVWDVVGENMLSFRPDTFVPVGVVNVGFIADRCLRRIEDGEPPVDERELLDVDEPLAAPERECLTT